MNSKHILRNFGLTENEVGAYLAALSLRDCSILQLSHKARMRRTTMYTVIESLVQKGLVGIYQSRTGMRIRAQAPEYLERQAERRLREIQTIIPELRQIQNMSTPQPSVTFFQGKTGYHTVLEQTLQKHLQTIYFIGALGDHDKIITDEWDYEYYVPERTRRKIRIKGLMFASDVDKMHARDHYTELRELRILPANFHHKAVKAIYENKVAIFSSTEEVICMVIESRVVADMERKTFDLFWEQSTPLDVFLQSSIQPVISKRKAYEKYK